MNQPIEATPREIRTFEEYLSTFLPKLDEIQVNAPMTPEETGIKMAEETLTQIQNLLLDNKSE